MSGGINGVAECSEKSIHLKNNNISAALDSDRPAKSTKRPLPIAAF